MSGTVTYYWDDKGNYTISFEGWHGVEIVYEDRHVILTKEYGDIYTCFSVFFKETETSHYGSYDLTDIAHIVYDGYIPPQDRLEFHISAIKHAYTLPGHYNHAELIGGESFTWREFQELLYIILHDLVK